MNLDQQAPIQPGHAPGWQSSRESASRSERITRWVFSIVAVIMTTWVWAGLSLRELLALLPH
jgi:hypothetical protein